MSDPVASFIARWSASEEAERANYVLFLSELCDLLDLRRPDPATSDASANAYVFERAVPLHQPDGKITTGRIDLYRRGCFVLEAKQYADAPVEQVEFSLSPTPAKRPAVVRGTETWDRKMIEARSQAELYARNLPGSEEPPPFLLVVDVGHSFELFADFSQKGKAYLHFPDPRSHRIRLADLAKPEVRELLRALWLSPLSLDPSKIAARVTCEVAGYLAELAKLFERKHPPALVASFLSRCLFCMFAEDIGLLPAQSFTHLLDSVAADPAAAVPLLEGLFKQMNTGGYSLVLRKHLLHFNGGLFADSAAFPLDGMTLGLLRRAASLQWRHVEPAIFGTLLTRALDPAERHKLGAHYTPRSYVERLILPSVIEPLREEWSHVRAQAISLAAKGDLKAAIRDTRAFHHRLCQLRILDPACGSGNFLYVTLEHLKRLEGEVLELAESFGDNLRLDLGGETVDPHQFLGLEINPRAAIIAELCLWIGFLQWHHRNRGETQWPEPVLKAFQNIECRDAVLAYDKKEHARDAAGKLRFVWDRRTTKVDPVTGREVPDDQAVIPVDTFLNPRPTPWPQADYIVGNPPFLGTSRMREDLGDGYAETLRAAYPEVPESADFVMYWWHKAAQETLAGRSRLFGFITTNSLRQTFNRRVVQRALDSGLRLTFAIPDHPWVDTVDGAAVRIAMTVATALECGDMSPLSPGAARRAASKTSRKTPSGPSCRPSQSGDMSPHSKAPTLCLVTHETAHEETGENEVQLSTTFGPISADLTGGADVSGTKELQANSGLSSPGVKLHGSGFIVSPEQAKNLGLGQVPGLENHIRPYRNGRDLADTPRGVYVIDLFGLTDDEVRAKFPKAYDHVLANVKPERDANNRPTYRDNWWIFGEPRRDLRPALFGLPRYIATGETGKHRHFQFLDAEILPDNMLVVIASDDAFHLGVLSSRIHVVYALAAGGRLGMGNDPRYNKSRCFDPFPFPACSEPQKTRIRDLAEQLDAHRKRAQTQHGFGLTDIYNVLEKVRTLECGDMSPLLKGRHDGPIGVLSPAGAKVAGPARHAAPGESGAKAPHSKASHLTAAEKHLHDQALVATLRHLHDELDTAVADAYGWPWPLSDADILTRVVALNTERAAEEARGLVRWLRPDYQNPRANTQGTLDLPQGEGRHRPSVEPRGTKAPRPLSKTPWPATPAERTKAVDTALAAQTEPITAAQLAKLFTRAKPAEIQDILDTFQVMGWARQGTTPGTWWRTR